MRNDAFFTKGKREERVKARKKAEGGRSFLVGLGERKRSPSSWF